MSDVTLTPLDDSFVTGFHVKDSHDGRHRIEVHRMLYNWRLVTVPVAWPDSIARGWCYYGHGINEHGRERTMSDAFVASVAAAHVWDGDDATEPAGFNKRAGDRHP